MNVISSQLPPQSVFIGVGLLAAAALAVALGRAKRVPAGDLLAVFGGCVVIGGGASRLFWVLLSPSAGLQVIWQQPALVADLRLGGHSSFGALVGASLVVGTWLYTQRDPPARRRQALAGLDALCTGGLLGLALARIGCASNGCDFGKPTDLGWAIRHAPGTEAYTTHLEHGWIGNDAAFSLAVHPFALFLAAGTLCIVLWAVWATLKRDYAPGKVAFGASSAYLLWRFVAEWTRDPATVLDVAGGLNIHHLLAVAGLGLLAAVVLWLRTCDSSTAES